MDAVKIVVRGFGSVPRMRQIMQQLEELGFTIKEAFDGSSDSMGGLIETFIHEEVELESENFITFRAAIDDKPGDHTEHWQSVEVIPYIQGKR